MTPIGSAYFLNALGTIAAAITVPAMTTLAASIDASQTTLTIAAWQKIWPATAHFTIVIGSEVITVTGGHGTTTLTVTRGTGASHASGAAIAWKAPFSQVLKAPCEIDTSTDAGKLFIQNIVDTGPVFVIGFPERVSDTDTGGMHGDYLFESKIYFGYGQNDTATDWTQLTGLVETLRTEIRNPDNFTTTGVQSSGSLVTWRRPQVDFRQSPIFGELPITIETRN